jgi:hypothetical protein
MVHSLFFRSQTNAATNYWIKIRMEEVCNVPHLKYDILLSDGREDEKERFQSMTDAENSSFTIRRNV